MLQLAVLEESRLAEKGLICPCCKGKISKVLESRASASSQIRRRRECLSCGNRMTTYEAIALQPDSYQKLQQKVARVDLLMGWIGNPRWFANLLRAIAQFLEDFAID